MLVKVEISSFTVDSAQNIPIIILKESDGERTIPIAIGPYEAGAIAASSTDVGAERPLTIDLCKLILEELGGSLRRVVIYDLVSQIYLAHLYIQTEKSLHIIDCRPSDAIALALRCRCEVFVKEIVFEKSEKGQGTSEKEKLRRTISSLDTLNFGKYYIQ